MTMMEISLQLNRAVVVDYSDGNGNVSGGESDDDDAADSRKQLASNSLDNEIHSETHHELHNEIEESTAETSTKAALNVTLPCDSDRGGCDHECQMVKYDYDPEPVLQCSCYRGFILDELDGRRCHGEEKFFS